MTGRSLHDWLSASSWPVASGIAAALITSPGPLGGAVIASDAALGQYLSGECVTCHRRDGQDKNIPSIIGLPADRFIAALRSYKSKEKPNPAMQTIAGRLNDEEMQALAAYFEALKGN